MPSPGRGARSCTPAPAELLPGRPKASGMLLLERVTLYDKCVYKSNSFVHSLSRILLSTCKKACVLQPNLVVPALARFPHPLFHLVPALLPHLHELHPHPAGAVHGNGERQPQRWSAPWLAIPSG